MEVTNRRFPGMQTNHRLPPERSRRKIKKILSINQKNVNLADVLSLSLDVSLLRPRIRPKQTARRQRKRRSAVGASPAEAVAAGSVRRA
jgi:hypothetical protein